MKNKTCSHIANICLFLGIALAFFMDAKPQYNFFTWIAIAVVALVSTSTYIFYNFNQSTITK